MKENTYKLADDIWGIGFKTADQIAMKLGFGKESYVRLRSGLMYTLSELSNDGHVFAEKQQLIDKASELLDASPETVIMTMDDMLKKEELILEKSIVRTDEEGTRIGVSDCGNANHDEPFRDASEESYIYGHYQGKEGACDRRD